MSAALVLLCLQESCYVAILSMRALRPRFHATSGFFLNRRIGSWVSPYTIYLDNKVTEAANADDPSQEPCPSNCFSLIGAFLSSAYDLFSLLQ